MKIVILGSDGFVGRNLLEDLQPQFDCYGTTRRTEKLLAGEKRLLFDLEKESTWSDLVSLQPDCIINCVVGGAVKHASDVKHLLDTNYLHTIHFFDFLARQLPDVYLIHLGTAFEYNMRKAALTEETSCRPRTYYGISKMLASHYLLESGSLKQFTVVRPFNLFGPYDKEEKIIPHLICAQLEKKPIALTEGRQERDYFFVKDLSRIIADAVENPAHRTKVINAGSGKPVMLMKAAGLISKHLPEFDPKLWGWSKLPYREGEGRAFYNASTLLRERGLVFTEFEQAVKATVAYYCAVKQKQTAW